MRSASTLRHSRLRLLAGGVLGASLSGGLLACGGVFSGPSGEHSGPHVSTVQSVALSPDGTLLATGGQDRIAKAWSYPALEGVRDLYHEEFVVALAFSPDGRLLATGGYEPAIRIWDTTTWEPVGEIPRSVLAMDWSGDQLALAVQGSGTVEIWNATTRTLQHTLEGHVDSVHSVRFSPDGSVLVSGSKDRSIRMWDTAQGGEIGLFAGHDGAVLDLAFSPDGQRLASGASDKKARLWDVQTQEPVRQMAGHADWIVGVDIDPTGRALVTVGRDGKLRIWDAVSGQDIGSADLGLGALEDVLFVDAESVVTVGQDIFVRGLSAELASHEFATAFEVRELDDRCVRLVDCGKALIRGEETNDKGVELVRIAREMDQDSPDLCLTTLLTVPAAVGAASPPECAVTEKGAE